MFRVLGFRKLLYTNIHENATTQVTTHSITGTIERFEDIDSWKRARQLTQQVYAVSRKGAFSKDFGLRDQVRRASVSIMSNIAEGFERGGTNEFMHFLSIAKGSAGEVRSLLYVALDEKYIEREHFEVLCSLISEISNKIGGLMRYLQQTNIRGQKFKDRQEDKPNPKH